VGDGSYDNYISKERWRGDAPGENEKVTQGMHLSVKVVDFGSSRCPSTREFRARKTRRAGMNSWYAARERVFAIGRHPTPVMVVSRIELGQWRTSSAVPLLGINSAKGKLRG
jgi:hypothetical protein